MKASLLFIIATAASSQAAIIRMYPRLNCQGDYQERNIWDNTCAPTDEFWSYTVVFGGGSGQYLRAYCPHNCGNWDVNSCKNAQSLNVCYNAVSSCGSSHAIGSSLFEC
ncbi:hypothetical protein NQ176_g7358 [Zarea fungicola]|uniref:Uncharacterized protein n=1 Tax=Zarea fungicola TaxID=93591 RepID=A0ACC1N0V5_9HYPO|nr:hypothetical protein NQ176_g7358 [Lecanicillium fungicola]